ncbi:MAG TPA: L,D-transpeptidase, partial [Clostridiaceae bacterium]|nr:L,D-transpeptidase [Clostridiaceae bacterium]
GGDIYLTNGSHGCVNAPFSVAQTVFNNITPGTPVVVYR